MEETINDIISGGKSKFNANANHIFMYISGAGKSGGPSSQPLKTDMDAKLKILRTRGNIKDYMYNESDGVFFVVIDDSCTTI